MISKTWLLCKANEQRKLLPPLYFTSSWFQHLKQNESLLLITDYDIAQSLCFDQYSLETSCAAFLYTHISLTDNNNESWKKKTTFLSWLQNSLHKKRISLIIPRKTGSFEQSRYCWWRKSGEKWSLLRPEKLFSLAFYLGGHKVAFPWSHSKQGLVRAL